MEGIIAGIFGLVIGVVGLWTGIRQLRNRAELNRWNTTSGRVIERGIYKPDAVSLSTPAFQYAPLVKYAYQVDRKEFVSNDIHPKRIQLPQRNTKDWAQKKADSFTDEVTVHYNPQDPGEAFLKQTSKVNLYLVTGVSGLIILFGLIFLLAGISN